MNTYKDRGAIIASMFPFLSAVERLLKHSEPRLQAFLVSQITLMIVGAANTFTPIDDLIAATIPCGIPGCDCHVRLRKVMESLRDGVHSVSREIQSENMAREGVFAPGVPIYPKKP